MEWCTRTLQRVSTDLSAYKNGRHITVGSFNAIFNQQEIVYHKLVGLDTIGELYRNGATALQLMASAIEEVWGILESYPSCLVFTCYSSSLVYDVSVGRPQHDVPISNLEFLMESRFSVPQTADVL